MDMPAAGIWGEVEDEVKILHPIVGCKCCAIMAQMVMRLRMETGSHQTWGSAKAARKD
jgi:hypothetical protein